ncbi:MAG: DUF370 domain-containing protein [Bacillota bacterium]|nr:DUF370 domain-containing protein [Bacillota bacterium]MDP4158890.1 DUF370 domain-containing protein [Bacillota bacterium]
MYLHLGGDILVNQDRVVAIIDLETVKKGQINEKFLRKIKNDKTANYISEEGKEKTLIITTEGYYLSPISSTTLYKRSISNTGEE